MVIVQNIFKKTQGGFWIEHQVICTEALLSQSTKADVSFMSMEDWNQKNRVRKKGFCHQRFHPNIIISQLQPSFKNPGTYFDIGGARFCVENKKHTCHEACPVYQNKNQVCSWKNRVFFAKVVRNGSLQQGALLNSSIDQLL